jgi:hypothetical protein
VNPCVSRFPLLKFVAVNVETCCMTTKRAAVDQEPC